MVARDAPHALWSSTSHPTRRFLPRSSPRARTALGRPANTPPRRPGRPYHVRDEACGAAPQVRPWATRAAAAVPHRRIGYSALPAILLFVEAVLQSPTRRCR